MSLIDRVKNICLTPTTEWAVIAGEASTPGTLLSGYTAPLAAVGAIAGFIGGSIVGISVPFVGMVRTPIVSGLVGACLSVVMVMVGMLIMGALINWLAPNFGGQKDSTQALKVAVYAATPALVAGILNIIPLLGTLAILGALYSLYLLYLGLPTLMKAPQDKAIGYTAVVVICGIVLSAAAAAVMGTIAGVGFMGAGMLSGNTGITGNTASVDPNSALGRLEQFGQQMEQSSRQMDAAQQSGDANAQAAAAVNALGALLGGGARVEPVALDQLRPFVPETFAGLPRTSTNAERAGMAGLMIAKAEAAYGDGDAKHVTLEVQDTGGISGIVGLASWVGVEQEKEDGSSIERTRKVDGRMVHERQSKTGGSHEYGIVLAERFVVNTTGRGVSLDDLKAAVARLDLAKLEGMHAANAPR